MTCCDKLAHVVDYLHRSAQDSPLGLSGPLPLPNLPADGNIPPESLRPLPPRRRIKPNPVSMLPLPNGADRGTYMTRPQYTKHVVSATA